MSCIDESFLISSFALSAIVFTKYSNNAINEFVRKLQEEYPNIDITRDKLFKYNKMRSFEDAKDLFMEMNPNVSDKTFRDELYEKYNAFQHTFIPAQMARTFGKDITIEMGIQKEIFNWNSEISKNSSEISFLQDTYKDLHNNDVGAFYGEKIAKGELTFEQVVDILFDGVMNETRSEDNNAVISNREWVTEEEYKQISIKKLYTISQLYTDYNSNREIDMDPSSIQKMQTKYNGYRCKFFDGGGVAPSPHDPIIFDLDGDGIIETTNIYYGVYFDHDDNGFAESSAWVGENDGILFSDNNNNNSLDNGSELITADNLAQFDTNSDGVIDANDDNFGNLKIIKGDGSILTLEEAGISSISASTNETDRIDENGNQQFADGTFTKTDGTTGEMGAFYFETETSESFSNEWLNETDEISDLPDISGSGNIYSLHQAMLRDESGELVA